MPIPTPDRAAQLRELPPVTYEKSDKAEKDRFDQVNLAAALLALADLGHERQLALCQGVAEHVLGHVPEPDDASLGDQ